MSKHAWILWAVILMIPGAIGLGYRFARQRAFQEQIAQAVKVTTESSASDEYLSMYENWFRLPPAEKAENPWGHGSYGGPEIQERLKKEQPERLLADIVDLDKGAKQFPDELAETLYGSGWRQAVEEYRHQRSKADMILIGTIFLLAGSGLLLAGGLGKLLFVYSVSKLKGTKDNSVIPQETSEDMSDDESPQAPSSEPEDSEDIPGTRTRPVSEAEKVIASSRAKAQQDAPDDKDRLGYFESRRKAAPKPSPIADAQKGSLTELSKSVSTSPAVLEKPARDSYFGWAIPEEQSSDMETLMTTEPLTKELNDLTEEVSAIRQFAAQQQDQVRKLQDGYDWMIIRRFCMRIIRSIDNIEDRINRMDDPDSEVALCLEDIRDELVFALESSGIEQFNPELKMPFKGLEKYAEAVRGRVVSEDESLCGCIAEIVRPGYQYLISDDDVKIVRCAQVKLYDTQ